MPVLLWDFAIVMRSALSCIVFFLLIVHTACLSAASELSSESDIVETDKKSSMDWSRPVVSRGFGDAKPKSVEEKLRFDQYKSGQVLYFFGDYKKTIEKWEPLLTEGFAPAQAGVAWLYQMGLGVEKNTKKAYDLYLLAAQQENSVAQNNLGVMYEQGIEVEVNLQKARIWYEKSAASGYRFAQFNYANLLLEGRGGEQNTQLAMSWYKKAAEQAVKQAVEKLSELTEK